jgi:hypothetical protein
VDYHFNLREIIFAGLFAHENCFLPEGEYTAEAYETIRGHPRRSLKLDMSKIETAQFTHENIEVLSWRPRIFLHKGFLSPDECDYIIQKGSCAPHCKYYVLLLHRFEDR